MNSKISKISKLADVFMIIATILYCITAVLKLFDEQKKQKRAEINTNAITVAAPQEVIPQEKPAE